MSSSNPELESLLHPENVPPNVTPRPEILERIKEDALIIDPDYSYAWNEYVHKNSPNDFIVVQITGDKSLRVGEQDHDLSNRQRILKVLNILFANRGKNISTSTMAKYGIYEQMDSSQSRRKAFSHATQAIAQITDQNSRPILVEAGIAQQGKKLYHLADNLVVVDTRHNPEQEAEIPAEITEIPGRNFAWQFAHTTGSDNPLEYSLQLNNFLNGSSDSFPTLPNGLNSSSVHMNQLRKVFASALETANPERITEVQKYLLSIQPPEDAYDVFMSDR